MPDRPTGPPSTSRSGQPREREQTRQADTPLEGTPQVDALPKDVAAQVDLDLGEAVYRQQAGHGGWTPASVAAAQVTIERAVEAQQPTRPRPSNPQRLNALADRVGAASDARRPAPAPVPGLLPPAPPAAAADVARRRAVAAQIWDDTRADHDPPARAERR